MHRITISFFVCAFAAVGQTGHIDPAALERVALAELSSSKTPGAAVAVVLGDRVVFSHGYGVASVDTGAPVSPNMLFRLGSTTKMFTAASVVGLSLDGRIDLEAPASRYIQGLDVSVGKLTANLLLSHTSGLRDEAPMFGSHDDSALGNGIRAWKSDFFFAKPGEIYSYSNPGFWLAGFLAESVSGKPYADVVEERLFRPLGMERSTLRPTMAMTWPLAQGHDLKDGKLEVIRPAADNAASWPAGSIFSSALDLSRWVMAFLNDGAIEGKKVLPPKLIAIMSSSHARIPGTEATYGYGLQMSKRRGVQWVEHSGSRAGYGSMIRMAPEQRFAVIIVANRSGSSMPKLAEAICEEMLALTPETKSESATHPIAPEELKRYAGTYVNGATRISLHSDAGVLVSEIGSNKTRYTRAGNGFVATDKEDSRLIVEGKFVFTGGRAFRRVE